MRRDGKRQEELRRVERACAGVGRGESHPEKVGRGEKKLRSGGKRWKRIELLKRAAIRDLRRAVAG